MVTITIKQIALVIKREMNVWRDQMSYIEIETFVGCVLANLKVHCLLTEEEEKWMRNYLVE